MPSPAFYLFPFKGSQKRQSACLLCCRESGNLVGQVSYFGLEDFDMIQCPECGLISIDPVPAEEVVKEGCTLLYASGYGAGNRKQIVRGFAKSFRRGSAFARRYLKQSKKEFSLLEVGAGDGYFSMGIQSEIPQAKVTLLDIVEELIPYYQEHHGCRAMAGEFSPQLFSGEKFDLILFRDLLEHARDPVLFLKNASQMVSPQGQIFFITPNGKEDFWLINQRFLKTGGRALLLLNHFHYFLPETLNRMLNENRFDLVDGYKFGLKQHRQGLGHQEFHHFEKQELPKIDSHSRSRVTSQWKHNPAQVKNHWLGGGTLSRVYGFFNDREKGKEPFFSPIGHEFSVLARKSTNSGASC